MGTLTRTLTLLLSHRSFNDLERGHQPRGGSIGRSGGARNDEEVALLGGEDDKRFTALADRISLQVFRINSNTAGIESLVKQLGSKHGNPALRSKLSNLTEATKELVKSRSSKSEKGRSERLSLEFSSST